MPNGPLGLEHPLVVSDDLDALAERYRAMGFAPTRKGYHPWGTGTQLVLFPDNFIELMGIDDRLLIDEPSETGFRFGRFIADQLNRREGIAMIALHSEDAAADAAAVTARGVEPDGLVNFRREVTLPDGATDEAVVSLAMLIDWEQPQLSHFICQQHRPEFVWVPEWMDHPNGALAIEQVVYAAAEPDALRQRFAGIWGEHALHDLGTRLPRGNRGRRTAGAGPAGGGGTLRPGGDALWLARRPLRDRDQRPRRGHQPGAPADDAEQGAAPAHGGTSAHSAVTRRQCDSGLRGIAATAGRLPSLPAAAR